MKLFFRSVVIVDLMLIVLEIMCLSCEYYLLCKFYISYVRYSCSYCKFLFMGVEYNKFYMIGWDG